MNKCSNPECNNKARQKYCSKTCNSRARTLNRRQAGKGFNSTLTKKNKDDERAKAITNAFKLWPRTGEL